MDEPPASYERLQRGRSALLVIDVQERLLAAVGRSDRVVWNTRRLLDAAALFGVPAAATEQYPERLGDTEASLAALLGERHPKRRFSCSGCEPLLADWQAQERFQIVTAGIETHVCVLQSVLDLLAAGFAVQVVTDAVGARFDLDHDTALRRMESAGATLTTTEAALFEWCDDSRDPQFKALSSLIRETPPGA